MRVITKVTVHHKADEKADVEVLAPGEHDFPPEDAKRLIAAGHAVAVAVAAKAKADKADAAKGQVTVTEAGKGPQVSGDGATQQQ